MTVISGYAGLQYSWSTGEMSGGISRYCL